MKLSALSELSLAHRHCVFRGSFYELLVGWRFGYQLSYGRETRLFCCFTDSSLCVRFYYIKSYALASNYGIFGKKITLLVARSNV